MTGYDEIVRNLINSKQLFSPLLTKINRHKGVLKTAQTAPS